MRFIFTNLMLPNEDFKPFSQNLDAGAPTYYKQMDTVKQGSPQTSQFLVDLWKEASKECAYFLP